MTQIGQVGYFCTVALQIALLCVQSVVHSSLTTTTVATTSVGIAGLTWLSIVSFFEHSRTSRLSSLLVLYLGFSTPVDAIRARTLWSMPHNDETAAIFTTVCVCKFCVFLLELVGKTETSRVRPSSVDARASVVSRAFEWWMLPLFRKGYQTPLQLETLPEVEPTLCGSDDSQKDGTMGRRGILHHLLRTRGALIGSAVSPRLCLAAFTYAQPFLVHTASTYVAAPDSTNTYQVGGGLIGAYFLVYVGIAVTRSSYRHCTARAITTIRAELVNMIFARTLNLSSASDDRSSATTMMSAHVERFAFGARQMHECWACLVEIGVGTWLLVDQLGLVVAATGGLTLLFILITVMVLVPAGRRQNRWLQTNEARITATIHSLKVMKGVKMTGAHEAIRRELLRLRTLEMRNFRRFREMLLVVAWSAWIPAIMSPVLGFVLYNVLIAPKTGRILDPAAVFRSLTVFSILNNSVATLIESSINLATSIASLQRIQGFLLADNLRREQRHLRHFPSHSPSEGEDPTGYTMTDMSPSPDKPVRVQLQDFGTAWTSTGTPIVDGVCVDVSAPTVVAVVGNVGCGKSTLLCSLLGETPCVTGSMAITNLHDRPVGYCSQSPWLMDDSIRNNIVGSATFDAAWYRTVLEATALIDDLRSMPLGDDTGAGSQGGSLSGGQKKRIALARAIYLRSPLLILDDPFNGLDARTEAFTLQALLGPAGLLRQSGALVVWATSSRDQAQLCDHKITLNESEKHEKLPLDKQEPDLQRAKVVEISDTQTGSDSHQSIPLPHTVAAAESTPASDLDIYKYVVVRAGRLRMVILAVLSAVFAFGMVISR